MRLGLPQPVIVTLFGVAVALVPVVPDLAFPPDLILPVVLPPLLFAATLRTSPREFRQNAPAVLILAVGLTVATAALVAVVAHAVALPWTAAWLLGAVVSPPDPVAATTIARRLRLPGHLVTILKGEGLFNDATALVLFQVAVAAAVAGGFSPLQATGLLVGSTAGGLALGLVVGVLTRRVLSLVEDASTETTVSLVAPYAAYLLAERLGVSGVLAVLALGLYLRTGRGHRALTSRGWLDGRAVWRYADFALTSMAFALLGVALTQVIGRVDDPVRNLPLLCAVLAAVVLGRIAWVFATTALARRWRDPSLPARWREAAVVSWSGMRGVVTLATALAVPMADEAGDPLRFRDPVVLVALSIVLVTLVVQGLTLSPLVRALGEQLRPDAEDPEALDLVASRYDALLERSASYAQADHRGQRQALRNALAQALDAERTAVLDARRRGDVSAETADAALADIEARAPG